MPKQPPIGLDNPAFHGRLRSSSSWELSSRPAAPVPRRTDYTAPASRSIVAKRIPAQTAPTAQPAVPMTNLQSMPSPPQPAAAALPGRRYMHESEAEQPRPLHTHSKLQLSLVSMAVLVFLIGLGVSVQGLLTNRNAAAQVSALSQKTDKQTSSSPPSTTKPSSQAVSQYFVAPDLPRYLTIPKLGVHARVLQTGVTSSGALGTPSNVFDTAWYTGSAKPGQPGATLIDGHVSSWTTHGVFYGLKKLVNGDTVQIQRGDGTILTYRVVKTQVYADNNVDMQAAITPVTVGKSGLNLITCTGQVKPHTSNFNQRLIVFTEQI